MTPPTPHDGRTPEVSLEDLGRALAPGDTIPAVTVVDVREPAEYVTGHVPGARLIPMGQLPARASELDKGTSVYVVCATGNRSAAMTDFLVQAGFDAHSVAGGTQGWQRLGRPIVTGPQPS